VKLKYFHNIEDLMEATTANERMLMGRTSPIGTLLLVCGFVIAILLFSLLIIGTISSQTILLMLFSAFLVKYFPRLNQILTFKQKIDKSLIQCEIFVKVSDERLIISTVDMKAIIKWSAYTYWQETPNLFLVYSRNDTLYTIFPKRAFTNDDNINEFRELLRTRIIAH
jgi:YcxB-like protein